MDKLKEKNSLELCINLDEQLLRGLYPLAKNSLKWWLTWCFDDLV